MSAFYTNCFTRGNKLYYRGYSLGLRVKEAIDYKPYLFVNHTVPGEKNNLLVYRTIKDEPVSKIDFGSIKQAKHFIERYADVSNVKLYGLTNYAYVYLFDKFGSSILEYSFDSINIGYIDIECAADQGFPDIQIADKEITAITIRCKKRNYVFGCGEFVANDPNTYYIKCASEEELLRQFINCWVALDLDIVSGWNIEFFDIPYIINRIKRVFGEESTLYKKLSPFGFIDEKKIEFRGKEIQSYQIHGLTVLDYYQVYRKFTFGNQETYKLDFIAKTEIGEQKVVYSEYGSLLELYKNNFQKFIEYNIYDVVLVEKLEDKLKFIEQIVGLAYSSKVNYIDTMTTVRMWDVTIHNYLLAQHIVVPHFTPSTNKQTIIGGHVKEPKIGMSKWVVSFDLNSLYPHLIMQYNISPDTFVKRMSKFPSIEELLEGNFNIESMDPERTYSYAANGTAYRSDVQGFLPALMERIYNDRVKYKKLMIAAKKKHEETKDPADEKLIAQYHNRQMAMKILLNSAYGALANAYYRWYDLNYAEAVTSSGQLTIQWAEKYLNKFLNSFFSTTDEDYVVASDTDSLYISLEKYVESLGHKDEQKICEELNQFCNQVIQPQLDRAFIELKNYMNAFDQKMVMKRETIASKAIWRGRKMYILNALNVEGVQYAQPKLKMAGIETVRSSTPHACRENIKKALDIILNKDEGDLQKFVKEFKQVYNQLPFSDIAFPRGVNGMTKYRDREHIYAKGTPIQVKGSLIYNQLIKICELQNLSPIFDGDKIKFVYLVEPNPIGESVIASPDDLPEEFALDQYIDKDLMFSKSFIEPIKSITSVIGWEVEKRNTLHSFFED